MSKIIFQFLIQLDAMLWNYVDLFIIIITGISLAIYSNFFQFKALFKLRRYIKDLMLCAGINKQGIHPLKLYFASMGGMVGLGNIVTIISTITIGSPGSIIWLWIASFLGTLIKYSEVYLGVKYRIRNEDNGFDGGPVYYLKVAFKSKILPILVCFLLCVYGAEVSQFLILTDAIVQTFNVNRYLAIIMLLILTLTFSIKGIKKFAHICSNIMPLLMTVYIIVGLYILIDNFIILPNIMKLIISSFFKSTSPIGDISIGGIFLAAHYGVSKAVYSGDIGIGYDSIIQSETQTMYPEKQARMSIFALLADSFICTISILIILTTGVWEIRDLQSSEYVINALKLYFCNAEYFMTILFLFAGCTTITGYLVVGQKCAKYLNRKYGQFLYLIYAISSFVFFSFYEQERVILIMSISGGLLMLINIIGLFKLRKSIKFI